MCIRFALRLRPVCGAPGSLTAQSFIGFARQAAAGEEQSYPTHRTKETGENFRKNTPVEEERIEDG